MPFIAPLLGFLGGLGSFIGGLGIIGKILIGIGINVAASMIARARAKKQQRTPGGVQFERQYGEEIPRQVACGLVGIAAHDCYVNTYGASNIYLQQIYTISDYYTTELSRVSINGTWVTLGAEDAEKGFVVTSGDFANLIWIKFIDGRQTTADDYLINNANPPDRWSENHIGVGVSYILVSMTYNQQKNNTLPDLFFEFKGAPLYDWRKDSTVGGSGDHRWNDVSTHEYSDNPIVIEYNFRRGFSINDDLFCGMDMLASDLPLDKWTAAANICDEAVEGEKRYVCSIMLDCMAQHGENISSLQHSCGGMIIDAVDGSWPLVGHDQIIAATFTDDDIIVGTHTKYREHRSMSDLVNSITGNYPLPDQLWAMVPYENQISETHVTIDRRSRDLSLDFPQVPSGRQAAQLASIYLYENRFEAVASITLRPRFLVIEAGDWVVWNSARYGEKTYIVTDAQIISLDKDNPRCVQLTLQERDGSIYDAIPTIPPIVIPTPPNLPSYLNELDDLLYAATSIESGNGNLSPAISASWNDIEDETVVSVEFQYWPTSQPANIFSKIINMPANSGVLIEGIVANTEYTIRTRLITEPGRVIVWSIERAVTTLNLGVDVDLSRYDTEAKNLTRDIWKTIDDLTYDMSNIFNALSNVAGQLHISTTVNQSQFGTNFARVTQEISTRASEDSALASSITSLEASLQGQITTNADAITGLTTSVSDNADAITANADAITSLETSLQGQITANADAITGLSATVSSNSTGIAANASAITAVQATVNGVSAEGYFLTEATVTGGGAQIDIALAARLVPITGDTYQSGLFLRLVDEGGGSVTSTVIIEVDKFIITDGSDEHLPFTFEDGIAKMQVANIGTVTAGILKSADDSMEINLDAPYFVMRHVEE